MHFCKDTFDPTGGTNMNRRIRTGAWVLIMAIVLALLMPAALATEYADGVYKGSAQGFMGDVKVKAAVVDGRIALITSEDGESDDVGKPAIDRLIVQVMEAQSPDVDAVAGATETSEAFIAALKDALTQAGWVEEVLPEITIITRQQVARVSAPTIDFGKVRTAENGVSYLDGDMVIITWEVEGEVQGYRIVIRNEFDSVVKRVDTSDMRYIMERSELSDSMTYTVTVTAIPRNGTLKANGVSTSAQFALYVAPEPTPTPEPLLQTGEISDSWEEIIAAIDDGLARQRYAVGATKALDLGELGTVHMQLAGFDLDERADGRARPQPRGSPWSCCLISMS